VTPKFQYRLARPDLGEKDLSVKRAVDCHTHENLLLLTKVTQQHYHGCRGRPHRSVKLALKGLLGGHTFVGQPDQYRATMTIATISNAAISERPRSSVIDRGFVVSALSGGTT
jgi:hypothetical protein